MYVLKYNIIYIILNTFIKQSNKNNLFEDKL